MTHCQQTAEPGWVERLDQSLAAHADDIAANFLAFATVAPDGQPAVRTVRYRLQLPPATIVLSTDTRTEKLRHLARQPVAEACWYFTRTREQYRLRGKTRIIDTNSVEHQSLLLKSWRDRSAESRQSFTWPTPGAPVAPAAEFQKPEPVSPPETFALLLLEVTSVDYLDLRTSPQERIRFRAGPAGWHSERVNP